MSAELVKTISALIIALLVATNTTLNADQLTALYKCGFWDGSEIVTTESTAKIKDDQLIIDDKKVGKKITKIVAETTAKDSPSMMDGGEIIAESLYEGSPAKWVAFYSKNIIELWSEEKNSYIVMFRIPAEGAWTAEVTDEYIYAYDENGNKVIRIELATGCVKPYQ